MTTLRPRRVRASLATLFACLLSLLAWTPDAAAQMDMVVDPISSDRFDAYVDRLGLTHDQRVAAEAMHEAYKKRYEAFRDGPLQAFAETMREMDGMRGGMPSRESVEKLLHEQERLSDRMRSMDARLFAEMQALLTPNQLPLMERVRRARERRYHETFLMSQANRINLVEMVDELDLDAAAAAAAEPAVVQYEVAVNRALGDLADASRTMILDLIDVMTQAMTESGLDPATAASDPEQMQNMMEVLREAQRKIGENLRKAEEHVYQVNRDGFERIVRTLPSDPAERLRARWQEAFFPGVYPDPTSIERLLQKVREHESIPASTKSEVAAVGAAWRTQVAPINRRMEDAVDEHRLQSGPMSFDFDGMQKHQQRLQELRTERQAVNDAAAERVLALLDESTRETLRGTRGPAIGRAGRAGPAETVAESVAMAAAEAAVAASAPVDASIVGPIDRAEFESYLARLGIQGDTRPIAELHHRDYLERMATLREERLVELVQSARERAFASDATEQDATAMHRARRDALRLIAQEDDALFDLLAPLVPPDHADAMDVVRRSRERARYAAADAAWPSAVDLASVARSLDVGADGWRALAAYEEATFPTLRERFELLRERDESQIRQRLAFQRASEAGRDPSQIWLEFQDETIALQRRQMEINRRLEEEAEGALPNVLAALPPDVATRFQSEYRRRAYPGVYPDPHDASRVLDVALRLRDLTPEQRAALEALRDEHRAEHERLCEALVAVGDQREMFWAVDMDDPSAMENRIERMRERQRLQHDRREWNATVERRARALLTAEQAKAVPGLRGDDEG